MAVIVSAKWACLMLLAVAAAQTMAVAEQASVDHERIGLFVLSSSIGAWCLISVAHRARILSTVRPTREARERNAAGRLFRLLATSTLIGAIELVSQVIASHVLRSIVRPSISMSVMTGMAAWFLLRGHLGVTTACVLAEDRGAFATLRTSARILRGRRAASIASRIMLVPIVGVLGLAFAFHGPSYSLAALVAAVDAVAVTMDALLEAAWFDALRPVHSASAMARVFE